MADRSTVPGSGRGGAVEGVGPGRAAGWVRLLQNPQGVAGRMASNFLRAPLRRGLPPASPPPDPCV